MASPVIKIKRSSVQNNAPSTAQLELGELALNTYDGKLFTEINDGTASIVEIGGHLNHLAATGISTFGSGSTAVIVGGATTSLLVRGDCRVVGVLTVGSGSITLDESTDTINVGSATTITTTGFQIGGNGVFVHSTGYNVGNTFVHNAGITGAGANFSGVVTCTSLVTNGDVTFTGADYNLLWDKSDSALEFADDAQAVFGTGGDLVIGHNGSNSYVKDIGNNQLRIAATNEQLNLDGNDVYLRAGDGLHVLAKFIDHGANKFYYNHVKKLQTSSDGVEIIGSADISGSIDVDGTANLDVVDIDGAVDMASTLTLAGNADFNGNLDVDGTSTLDALTVSEDATFTAGIDVDGHTEVDNLKSVGIATFSNNAIHANIYSTGISTISGFRFPTADGDEDQALVTDGNGQLSFKTLSGGGGGATGAATTISAGVTTATQGQTVFSTPHPHNDGTNTFSTQVFVNGVKQRPQGASSTKDFTTSSNSTITFEEGLRVGDEVVSVVYFGHTIDEEYFTATQGQVLFPLSGSLSAQKNFRVFVNGVKQRVGSDFGVAAPVTLVTPCAEGAHVEIVCDNAEDAFVATDQQTNFTPTSTDISADNMQVYVNGIQLFKGLDFSIGSPSVTFTDATGLTVGDEVDVCIRRTA